MQDPILDLILNAWFAIPFNKQFSQWSDIENQVENQNSKET